MQSKGPYRYHLNLSKRPMFELGTFRNVSIMGLNDLKSQVA